MTNSNLISVSGLNSTLNLTASDWTNNATITASNNGTLTLGGNWNNLSQELRSAESAVRRYDTRKLKGILLRLVPEMARTPISTRPGAAADADVVSINRSADS